jgi:HPt (histidine-containing phosphotransfer) domain-containing protein
MNDAPVLFRANAALGLMAGDAELLRDVVTLTRATLPDELAGLRAAFDAASMPEAERRAHSIKGTAATLGAEALRAAALAVEQACRSADAAQARTRLDALEPLLKRFLGELDAFLQG